VPYRSIVPRHAALFATSLLLSSPGVTSAAASRAPTPRRASHALAQVITVLPVNGTVLTTGTISPLIVVWCDPTASMIGHTVTWQGQPLSGEAQAWANPRGCGNQLTSTFASVAVDFSKPLTLVASANDRSGQVTTTTTTYTMSASLVHLLVTAANQTTIVRRGAVGSTSFTVTNAGSIALPLTLAPS